MPGFESSVLTDVGYEALTDAEAGQHIQYTTMQAGDGTIYGGDTEMFALTNLKHYVMDFPITNFTNDGAGQITLVGVISSKNVTTGFYLREIGVRCTIDSGSPILYSVAFNDTPDYIPSAAESAVVIQSIQIIIKIDRAENVTVVVQPGLDVTCQNIGPGSAGAGWFRNKIGQICWFKRVTSPKNTLAITETADLISIDIPTIDVNLDMWVALGNPDIFPNFSTIQKALDYLIPLEIKPGIFVTIHVAAGTWVNATLTTVNHRNGRQIKIIGTIGTVKNISTASGNSTLVTLNGTSGAFNDMAVGDYFLYKNFSRGEAMAISGIWKVASKTTSSISFDPWWWGSIFPTLGPVTGGTVTPLKTVLKCGPNQGAFSFLGQGLGLLKYFACIGHDTVCDTQGLQASEGVTTIEQVGATNWYMVPTGHGGAGFSAQVVGSIDCLDCAANRNDYGFNTGNSGAKILLTNCIANSNSIVGFGCFGAQIESVSSAACGNKSQGCLCSANGIVTIDHLFAAYNNPYGFLVSNGGFVTNVANTTGLASVYGSNTVRDLQLSVAALHVRGNGPALSYGTVNIAPGTLSFDGSFFSP